MGITKIEWTATIDANGVVHPGYSFNPWIGCTKVSDGCKHCYAETLMDHRYGKVQWGPTGTRQRTSAANWRKPLQWNKQAQAEGVRYRVFCASLADVFENNPQLLDWRQELFALIEQTPNLDWLLLTKRPQHVFDFVPKHWLAGLPANIWLGTSVENQEQADKRIPDLMAIPAKVKFLSMEPLLGPVKLWEWSDFDGRFDGVGIVHDYAWQPSTPDSPGESISSSYPAIDWIIVGGESGPESRPMQLEWAQSIAEQCKNADVPFFMKQLGGHPDKRHNLEQFPVDLRVRQFPG